MADNQQHSQPVMRLGTGAGFSADRLDPAVALARDGALDALIFECVGERTLAFGHRDRQANPKAGYNPWLRRRMQAVLPHTAAGGTRIITNMGVANPLGAAKEIVAVARDLGLAGLKVAAVLGDDVSQSVTPDTALSDLGRPVHAVGRQLVGANAYLGADAIIPALSAGADVIVTGRVSDPALFLAPLCHHFGWSADDWSRLGAGTLVGHLMECAAQITGGYFADPGYKDVPGLAYVGFPIAEVNADGGAVITKLPDAGGCVTERTVKEQMLYEVHDPKAYLTPDVVADFSKVTLRTETDNRVAVANAGGRERPEKLKVTVAFDGGLLAEAGISYAGPGALDRARLAGDIVQERMHGLHGLNAPLRIDYIGESALHGTATRYASDAQDIRVRAALRGSSREEAELLLWEVESLLCCGPAAGGGYRGQITPSVVTHDAFIDRRDVKPHFEMLVA